MHEDRLIDAALAEVKSRLRAAGGARGGRIVLELSPDSHMDEMSVELHFEAHLAEEPELAGARLEYRHVPPRLYCPDCQAEFERPAGVFTCPRCGRGGRPCGHSSGLRVLEVETEP